MSYLHVVINTVVINVLNLIEKQCVYLVSFRDIIC